MGLENLKSVFNDLSKNSIDPISDINSPVSDLSKESDSFKSTPVPQIDSVFANKSLQLMGGVSLIDEEIPHSFGTNGSNTELIKIQKIDFKSSDSPQSKQPDIDLTDEKIKKRKISITEDSEEGRIALGTNGKLGFNDLILEKLYNVNHTAVTLEDREPINIGKYDENGSPVLINTLRSGMGDLTKLDIRGYSSAFRTSLLGPEPYVVNEIGSKTNTIGNNRDLIPFQAGLEDLSRLAKFYTSQAGLAFIAKENITNVAIGSAPNNNPLPRVFGFRDPLTKDLNTPSKLLFPPANNPLQGNTGFLNFTNQFRDLGNQIASLRKPFTVEYSKRHTLSLPYGFLGDNFRKVKFTNPITGNEDELRSAADEPFFKKPRYLGLGQGPGNRKLNNGSGYSNTDSLSDSAVINSIGTDTDGNEAPPEDFPSIGVSVQRGDFYVRIRDLRDNTYIYFRGYVTGITENVNPSFTSTNYIGRSEPVYLYERGDRDVSFNLKVYPANVEQQDNMYKKLEKLTSLAYPAYLPESDESSLIRMKAPFTELYMAHIGSKPRGQFGFIKSISYTVNESGDWDALDALPRLFDIALSYQILHRKPPSINTRFYRAGV